MLGELVPPDQSSWLLNLQFFATLATCLIVAWNLISGRPQKREVTQAEEFATRREFEAHAHSTKIEIDRINGELVGFRDKLDDQIGELHEKINTVSNKVSSMDGSLALLNQQVMTLDNRLERFIERQ